MAIEFQNCEHLAAHPDGNSPTGDHFLTSCRLNARRKGHCCEIRDPDRSTVVPGAAGQLDSFWQGKTHALVDEEFRTAARRTPSGGKFEPIFVGIDVPLQGHVPTLRDTEGLKNASGCDFRRGIFANDLADH